MRAIFNERELEIISFLCEGLTNKQISQRMYLSIDTIKWYNKKIFAKLSVKNRIQAASIARLKQLVPLSEADSRHQPKFENNIPAEVSSFIGRRNEIRALTHLIQESRLVVITGPGGIGKTRLAIRVIQYFLDHFQDGVWYVELGALRNPDFVLYQVAQIFSIDVRKENSILDAVQHYLQNKELLLVLDNFEHLASAADQVSAILENAHGVKVLITSRKRLNVYGEKVFQVEPMAVPDAAVETTGNGLLKFDAMQLFLRRAAAVGYKDPANANEYRAIARICARLEGIPLAIELAAPRVRILSPAELADRLDESLDVLANGPCDVDEKHKTLAAAFYWSYNLLRPDEQKILRLLTVFRGGARLEAIQAVAGLGSSDVIRTVSQLVDHCLIVPVIKEDGERYFNMLEIFREKCSHMMQVPSVIREKHAFYYLNLVEEAAEEITGKKFTFWIKRLKSEQENLRQAMDWGLAGRHVEFCLRFAAALDYYWFYRGPTLEGYQWLKRVLDGSEAAPLKLRGAALSTAGNLAYLVDTPEQNERYLTEALNIHQQLGDGLRAAWDVLYLGRAKIHSSGRAQEGRKLAQQALAAFASKNDFYGMSYAYNVLGELFRVDRQYAKALESYEETLRLTEITGERQREAMQYGNLGIVYLVLSDYNQAKKYLLKSLRIFSELCDHVSQYMLIGFLAIQIASTGNLVDAAALIGFVEASLNRHEYYAHPIDHLDYMRFRNKIEGEIGSESFEKACAGGCRMSLKAVVAELLLESAE